MENAYHHEYASVNGVRLHYVRAGKGTELVVLLHGWPEFWYSWRHQIEALRDRYTVVAVDMRGFNESEKPVKTAAYRQEEVAKDIVDLVAHLGFDKAVIVGHDWGGAVGWHIALYHPDIVSKFIVMNCPNPLVFIDSLKGNPRQVLRSWYMFFFQLPLLPEWVMGLDLRRFFERAFRGMAKNRSNFPDEVIERYVEAYSKPGALTGGVNYYRANIKAARSILRSKGRKVQAPTLMIWGEADVALGKELAEGTERFVDNSCRIHFLPGCSHWVQNDCPEAVNRAMLDFLDGTGTAER